MTDQTPESSQGQTEALVPATPAFSDVPVVAASDQTSAEDALIEKVLGRLAPEIDKRFQSAKDKRFSVIDKLGNNGDTLIKLADYMKANPQADAQAAVREVQRAAVLDALVDGQLPTPNSPAPVANRPTVDTSAIQKRATEVLTDAGIAFDDPEYTALVNKPHANPDAFIAEVEKFGRRRLKQQFQPGAASNAGGGGSAPSSSKNTLADKYKKEMLAARGQGMSKGQEIRDKYRAQGVDVDRVALS